ncbi:MAG: hypothetical protein RL444_1416 [Verrucomicrobiota bacterium]|jgi:hypothetical protein
MKHILPILTLTTLAAAASAQSAAAAGLSYNRAGLSYNTDASTLRDGSSDNGYSLSVEALVGSSNVWVAASAEANSQGDDGVSIGYLFKNVVAGIDATAFVGSNDGYGIIARRSLNEVVAGLEGRIVWSQEGGSNDNSFVYELAYNVNSKYQVAVSIADANGAAEETSVTVRYNF